MQRKSNENYQKDTFKRREMFVCVLFNCIKLKTVHFKKKEQQ